MFLLQSIDRAVIDSTVAAVFRDPAYQTRLSTTTLWQKLWMWIWDLLSEVFEGVSKVPYSGTIGWILLCAFVLLVVVAVGYKLYKYGVIRQHGIKIGDSYATDLQSPWAMAQQLAAAGKYTEAIHYIYAELLRRSARSGYIVLHASKTSGDYVRELRPKARQEHSNAFSKFVNAYELTVYREQVCNERDYNHLVTLASPFINQGARVNE